MQTAERTAYHRRAQICVVLIVGLFSFLTLRLFAIQVFNHRHYLDLREQQSISSVRLETSRPTLTDAQGNILAISRPVSSVYALPSLIPDKEQLAHQLAPILNMPTAAVIEKLNHTHLDDENVVRPVKFIWLKRKVADPVAEAIDKLHLDGVGLRKEYRRVYPSDREASNLVGMVDMDGRGTEGIERTIDQSLKVMTETSGARITFDVDARGKRLLDEDNVQVDWLSDVQVMLTTNAFIQHSAEKALDRVMKEHPCRSAVAIAVDPATGAILAMATRPAFDPNRPGEFPADARRNRPITDPYEPGSTMKQFIAAAALETNAVTPNQMFYCEKGTYKIGRRTVSDHKPYGTLPFHQVVSHSSNIGMVKVGQLMNYQTMHTALRLFGFGTPTGIDLPGESGGRLVPLDRWTSFTAVSVPMGYEISVTPLQMVMASAAIANDGVLMKPYVVSRVVDHDGKIVMQNKPQAVRRVVSHETIVKMKAILKEVVDEGTGTLARIKNVGVAGKTGTSKKIDPVHGGYSADKYISSFVGFAPVEKPRICVLVVVDEPRGSYYGGQVAAPAAADIIRESLAILQ